MTVFFSLKLLVGKSGTTNCNLSISIIWPEILIPQHSESKPGHFQIKKKKTVNPAAYNLVPKTSLFYTKQYFFLAL